MQKSVHDWHGVTGYMYTRDNPGAFLRSSKQQATDKWAVRD